MSEKIDDNSLIDDIEGLLFSEEFADSEDNSSIISEIASSEIPEGSEDSDENAETHSKREGDKGNPEKISGEESVLNIDESDNLFEKDFNFVSVETLRNSIWANRKKNHSFAGMTKPKHFVREGLVAETLRDFVVDDKEHKSPSTGIEKTNFFIRKGFEPESLRKSLWDKQDVLKSLIESDGSIFLMGDDSSAQPFFSPLTNVEKNNIALINQKETGASVKKSDGSKSSYALVETCRARRQPLENVEKSNISLDLEKEKSVERTNRKADDLNSCEEKRKELGFVCERDSFGTWQSFESVANCNGKLNPSSATPKTKKSIEIEWSREKDEAFYGPQEQFPVKIMKNGVPEGFKRPSLLRSCENNPEIACESIENCKEKKIFFTNTEKNKGLIVSGKIKAGIRDSFESESVYQMQTNEDVKTFFANQETTEDSISLNASNASVISENRRTIVNAGQTKVLKCSQKTKIILKEKNSERTLHNSVDCDKSINTSFASIKKNEELADAVKSNVSLNKEKLETIDANVTPSLKTKGLKKERKCTALNSAVSITTSNNLDFASFAKKTQEKFFSDVAKDRKKSSFENKTFDTFNKEIKDRVSQTRFSSFPLKGDSLLSKMNCVNTFEKKEMSLLCKKNAYNSMKGVFKYKKDLF